MPYPETACFWVERSGRQRQFLRRFTYGKNEDCPARQGGHDAQVRIEDGPELIDAEGYIGGVDLDLYAGDPRWPVKCDACTFHFRPEDEWQVLTEGIFTAADGRELSWRDRVPGMMWDQWWNKRKGPDGRSIAVICPNGGLWSIDDRATNCGMPDDHGHRCWCRHGDVPHLSVDKNCHTCEGGGGSIQMDDYHGHLQNGILTPG